MTGTVRIPGSKSLTARHLIVAALAAEPTTIRGALRSRDTDLMIDALRNLGVGFEGAGTTLRVTPAPLHGGHIETGLAGTVLRFLATVAVLADGPVSFDGDEAMYRRPIEPVLDGLDQLGVTVEAGGEAGARTLPFTVSGTVTASEVTLDASASSQFVSAFLLIGPHLPSGLTVRHRGGSVPSLPHVKMTVDVLRRAGAVIEVDEANSTWRVEPGPLRPGDITVEPDLSNAAPFLAAGAVTGGSVTVPDWPATTTQGGEHMLAILESMGASVDRGDSVTVTGPGRLVGIDVDMHEAGELTPAVAAVATLAEGPTRIRGVGHLRGHETNRLAALVTEIKRLGADAVETEDGLEITPGPLRADQVLETYADHRMATFAAVLGLRVPGTSIRDIACTAKTLPDFPSMWEDLLW